MTLNTEEKRLAVLALTIPAGPRTMPLPTSAGPTPPPPPPPTDIALNYAAVLGSSSTSTPALDTGSGFPAGMPAISINVTGGGTAPILFNKNIHADAVAAGWNGTDLVQITMTALRNEGAGGNGGIGGGNSVPAGNGTPGGPALKLQFPAHITNNGGIWGGGGGGAGGIEETGMFGDGGDTFTGAGGGGGGGAGIVGGSGGAGGTPTSGGTTAPGQPGQPGSATAGGVGGQGGAPGHLIGINGAAGGDPGQVGGNTAAIAFGGNAGDYIVGNAFATWLVMGDVRGGVG